MKTNNNIGDRFAEELSLYQSANNDDKSIKENFVIRINEFETIINTLLNTEQKDSLQHELILGARGSGKSTLLRRLEIEIKENKKLTNNFIAINLAEEQAGIYRLADLWYEIINEIAPNIILKNFSDFEDSNDYTSYLFNQISKILKEKKKRVVLLLDNFDKIIESINEDAKSLRAALINENNIQIIAASTRISEHFWKHDKPFYDFFRKHKLKALSLEEINTLLNHWGKIMNLPLLKNYTTTHRGNIEAVRILTDGLPRTLQFFIRILLTNNEKFDAKYIKLIMDKATPIYQERLWSLTKAQQKIVLETAFFWKPVTTKELVNLCRMESKLISSYLKQLVQYGIVEKLKTNTKNNKYRIAERFFNMWLIVTQGNPDQRRKAIYLTLFLEYWYNESEIKTLAKQHLNNLKNKNISFDKASVHTRALSQSKFIGFDLRDELIENTLLLEEKQPTYLLPKKSSVIIQQMKELYDKGNIDKALKKMFEIENEEDGLKFLMIGLLFAIQEEYEKAKEYFLLATKKKQTSAFQYLAAIYDKQKRHKEAEKYYLIAINKGNSDAAYSLAILYESQQEFEKAEKYYLLGIEKGHIDAIYNLAILYEKQEKFKKAEEYFLLAIEKGHVDAMYNLAFLYFNLNKEKIKALVLINNVSNKTIKEELLLFILEIWNGQFNDINTKLKSFFEELPKQGSTAMLLSLLYLNQKSLVLSYFESEEYGKKLQTEHQLLYFATLILNNKVENLQLEIPEEVIPTVEDIVKEVKEKNKFYA